MCLKDAVVQSLYTGHISWADIPSDDDTLELDDWKSYNKIQEYAKTSYQRVYNTRQRREQMRSTIKKQSNYTRTPYLTLKQNRFGPLRCESPTIEAPVEHPVVENPVVENPVVENPVVENPIVENPVVEVHIEQPIEHPVKLLVEEMPVEELPIELPVEESLDIPLEEIPLETFRETPKKIRKIKKMSAYEKKCKEKEKHIAKKIHIVPVLPRKKRFSLHNFFINLLVISFLISMAMAGVLVFM